MGIILTYLNFIPFPHQWRFSLAKDSSIILKAYKHCWNVKQALGLS